MTTQCDSCSAKFDVSGKQPGAVFKCPKCEHGQIRVPDLEELAPEDELLELEPEAELEPAAPRAQVASSRRRAAPSPRRASRGTGARRPRPAAAASSGLSSGARAGLLGGALVAVLAVVLVWFLNRKDGDGGTERQLAGERSGQTAPADGSGSPAKGVDPSNSARPEQARTDPKGYVARTRAQLSAKDAAGREELAAFCVENDLRTVALELRREALLIDPNQAETRRALGFEQYQGPVARYQGRWLSKKDLALAERAEKYAGSGELQGAATSADVFLRNARDVQHKLRAEFPEDRFAYRFGDGTMKQPFLVLIEKTGGANVAEYTEEYNNALSTLYEEFYLRYAERFRMEEIERPATVVVFDSVSTYSDHRENHPEGKYADPQFIGGYYQPWSQRLILWRQDGWRGVLLHEGAHMLIHYAFSGRGFEVSNQSPWFQEGLAEFFGGHVEVTRMVGGKAVTRYALGQYLPHRHATLKALINANLARPVLDLVKLSDWDFNQAKETMANPAKSAEEKMAASALVSDVYAQGWALIVYLNYADGGKYREVFDEYFEAEVQGGGHWGTLAELLELKTQADWEAFDQQFKSWVQTSLQQVMKEQNQ